jgi:hypothetical protein
MFMPEGPNQTEAPSGVADITPAEPETTSADIALMQRVLAAASRNVNLIPSDFMAYIVDFIQTSRLQIPIGQVFGFSQFTAQPATTISTSEATSSVTYTDLATIGPEINELSDGQYLLLFGAQIQPGAGANGLMSVEVNANAASDTDAVNVPDNASNTSTSRAVIKTLSGGGNTITAKYRSTGGISSTFLNRWMVAIKYA